MSFSTLWHLGLERSLALTYISWKPRSPFRITEIEGPLLTYDQMSDNDLLSCTNSLVTIMVVINHRNIPWGPRCLHPRTSHRQVVKRIFRYLKLTPEFGLWYSTDSSLDLVGFSDADFGGCRLDRKSTSGTCQFLGTSLVSWSSRKQASVALSSTEAEYVAAASCCSQILWMKQTLQDYGLSFGRVPIFVDNMSAISIAKNPVLHSRTKHISGSTSCEIIMREDT